MGDDRMRIRWALLGLVLAGCRSDDGKAPSAEPADSTPPGDDTAQGPLEVAVAPSTARAGIDPLTCTAPDEATLTWWHDGTPTDHVGSQLHPLDVRPGTWRCEATVGAASGEAVSTATPVGGNLLVVLLDDIGIDKVGAYGMHPEPAPTPVLDQLAADGVRFTHAYAMPICSPTRAALLTGQLPRRTGVGHLIESGSTERWLVEADTVPDVLGRSPLGPYTSALTGKWHLSRLGDTHHPADLGFTTYSGPMANPNMSLGSGKTQGYFRWEKNTQGTLAFTDTYLTTDTTDDAIEQLATLPEPWFLYVPYSAAHEPWHRPPQELHTRTALQYNVDRMDAMIEAVDHELGRLLASMTEAQRKNTTVVVLADNGSQAEVIRPPADRTRGKGTLYEGGVRVPMIVVSPQVADPGSVSDAFVHVVDVLPTAAALAGVDLDDGVPRDGHSLLPLLADPDAPWPREVLYAEKFRPNGFDPEALWLTIRDRDHKLVVDRTGATTLHEVVPEQLDEGPDLLAQGPLDANAQAAFDRLQAELAAIQDDLAP